MFVAVALNVDLMIAIVGEIFGVPMLVSHVSNSFRAFVGLCVFHEVSESRVHFCPRPRSSTEVSMGQANNSPTLKTRVVRALTPHEPCIHRMCVNAEVLGISTSSHVQQDADICKAPPHLSALFPQLEKVHSRNLNRTNHFYFPFDNGSSRCVWRRVFSPRWAPMLVS